jgi:hypothetical protein
VGFTEKAARSLKSSTYDLKKLVAYRTGPVIQASSLAIYFPACITGPVMCNSVSTLIEVKR